MWESRVWSLGREDPLKKGMATHSSTLAWKIPWTEKAGRVQSMGLQRVGHDWATSLSFFLSLEVSHVIPLTRIQLHSLNLVWVRSENVVFLCVQEKEIGWADLSLWHNHCINQVSCRKQMAHLTVILNLMKVLYYRGVKGWRESIRDVDTSRD